MTTTEALLLVESNTTGTGRRFAQYARELGLEPVLVAADPGRYPYVALDGLRTELADTADEAAVLAAAQRFPVAGVTSSSEYYIATAAAVAGRLGLPGPVPAAVRVCRDKAAQRRRLRDTGVPVPRFAVIRDPDAAFDAARDIGCPVVLKPVQGSGSVGVRRCATPEEAARHAAALTASGGNERGLAVPPDILVEEYMPGAEFSVEILAGAAVTVLAKHLGPPPYFVETGHDLPAPVGPALSARLSTCAEQAAAALGLGWGVLHVELRADGDRIRVVEVNPRPAGGLIPELVRRAVGVDLVAEQVRAALGLGPACAPSAVRRAAAIRFLVADGPGEMGDAGTQADSLAAAGAVPGVVDVALYRPPGTPVTVAEDFRGRLGHVIATDPATAEFALGLLKKTLFGEIR